MRQRLLRARGAALSLFSPISKAPSDVPLHPRASWALRAATCPPCPPPPLGMAPTYRLRLVVMVEVTNGSAPSRGVLWSQRGSCGAVSPHLQPPSHPQGLEERWQPPPEVPQPPHPMGDPMPGSAAGQDPFEKAYLLLLGQLNAVTEELARTREELRRSKASAEHEERKPLDFLKRRVSPCPIAVGMEMRCWGCPHPVLLSSWQNIAEMLGLGRSPEKAAGDDLKHAYDAVQVANK